jgi:hypothetical protein
MLHALAVLPSEEQLTVLTEQEAGWAVGVAWTIWSRGKALPVAGNELRYPGHPARGIVSILSYPDSKEQGTERDRCT